MLHVQKMVREPFGERYGRMDFLEIIEGTGYGGHLSQSAVLVSQYRSGSCTTPRASWKGSGPNNCCLVNMTTAHVGFPPSLSFAFGGVKRV